MVQNVKQVGEHRYRETFGRYYEDFGVGDVYEHRPGRTITETENTWFTLLTMNTHPMHFDAEYVSQKAIANLGWNEIALTAPLFIGDTLYAESEVLEKRESKSRPGAGIVTFSHVGRNQHGDVVATASRKTMLRKRPTDTEES